MLDSNQSRIPDEPVSNFWKSRSGMVLAGFLAVVGVLLTLEHSEHIFAGNGFLIGLLLFCVVMHFFMHGGHGGRGDTAPSSSNDGKE